MTSLASIRASAPYFWRQVDVTTSNVCWPYLGSRLKQYGRFNSTLAHRFAWMAAHGQELDPGTVIRHLCDNPPCVNPDHLVAGTQFENMQDMASRTFGKACRNGHPRSPETTAFNRKGQRRCLVCDRQRQLANRIKSRELRLLAGGAS